MPTLTDAQLAEVDRIIAETDVQSTYDRDFSTDDSIEVDDVHGTLREAARRVRVYLSTL